MFTNQVNNTITGLSADVSNVKGAKKRNLFIKQWIILIIP